MRARLSISSFFAQWLLEPYHSIFEVEIARRFAGTPIGWAKALAAKRLHDAQRFFDTAADVGVAYDQIVDIPGRIDDKRSSQTNTLALVQHIIGSADRLSVVAEKWIVHTAQFFRPLSMTFQRIDAHSENSASSARN